MYKLFFILLVFVCFFVTLSLAIYDKDDVVTKPPKRRENLPWPKRTHERGVNVKSHPHRHQERINHEEYTPDVTTTTKATDSYSRAYVTWKEVPRPHRITEDNYLERPNRERDNYEKNEKSLCEPKTTGQFVFLPDCRRFVNCFKGRGYIQACAPGTLFNPQSLECDFPAKVRCLVIPAQYKEVHEDNFDAIDEPAIPVAPSTNRHPFNRGFKSYKVNPIYQPDNSPGAKSNPRQHFNISSPFNIQPISSNLQPGQTVIVDPAVYPNPQQYRPGHVNTYGLPNPGYYINPGAESGHLPADPGVPQYSQSGYVVNSYPSAPGQPHNIYPTYSEGKPHERPDYIHQQGRETPSYQLSQNGQPQSGVPSYGQPQSGQSPYGKPHPRVQSPYGPSGQSPYESSQNGQPSYGQRPSGQSPYGSSQSGLPSYGQPISGQSPYGQPTSGQSPYESPQSGLPSYGQPISSQSPYGPPTSGQSPYVYPQSGQPSYSQPPSSQSPNGQPPSGQSPYQSPESGQPSYGQRPSGQSPYGSSQSGLPSYGQPISGQSPYGQPPSGQTPYESPQSGLPSYGQPISSQSPYGPPTSGQSPYVSPQSGQPSYSQPPSSQPPNGQPLSGQSPYQSPQSGQPSYGQPASGQSPYGASPSGQSSYGLRQSGQPHYGQPPSSQPIDGQYPSYQAPPYEQPPANQPPSTQPPYGQPPSSQSPYGQPPSSQPPYGQPPSSQNPYVPFQGRHPSYRPPQSGQPSYVPSQNSQPSPSDQPLYPVYPGYQPPNQNHFPQTNNDSVLVPGDKRKIKCPEGASGLYKHPWNCYKFLSCDHGRTFIMDCGTGTAFNPALNVCDYPYNVDCSGTVSKENQPDDADIGESQPEPDWAFKNDSSENPVDLIEQIDVRMPPPSHPITPVTNKTYHIRPDGPPVEIHNQKEPGSEKEDAEGITQKTVTQWLITSGTESRLPDNSSEFDVPGELEFSRHDPPKTDIPEEIEFPHPPHDPSKTEIQEEMEFPKRTPPGRTQKKILTPVKPPRNKQVARLRGGDKPSEGFLEVHVGGSGWGIVCDKPNSWKIEEANIVCKQLGYERGAELTWQGRPTEGQISNFKPVSFDTVSCLGNEVSILDCKTGKGKKCNPERDGVWVRCYNNRQSHCMPGEFSYNGRCYLLVEPKEEAKLESVGFSQGEALAHCQSRYGHLLDITSQDENDFISEWLIHLGANMTSPSVMTSGVGVSVLGNPLWIWEGSEGSFEYNNWWPGWNGGKGIAPKTHSTRALCVVAKRYFPCPNSGTKVAEGQPLCDAEYYFWDVEDCGLMTNKHPYVCERSADKIGCIIKNGVDYKGSANVTTFSNPCLSWDSPLVTPALKYRVSNTMFKATLAGHNYCRNIGGTEQEPWCFVRTETGIKKELCDIPLCTLETSVLEKSGSEAYTCGPNLFACDLNDCIPSAWLCDGSADCKNGYDELNCTGALDKFTKHASARLAVGDVEKWLHTSAPNCASRCLEAKDFVCRSFSHSVKEQVCLLSDSNIGLSGSLNVSLPNWDYYEMKSQSVKCENMFVCKNGKCINKNMTCNGKNDCGDRSDEKNCSAANLGYEIRLTGGNSSNEGYIEIKILGEWGVICDDQFDLRDAEVACRELGFSLGAVEIRPHSAFQLGNSTKPLYLVDDLQCRGNETSIRDCEFSGWGVHNCGDDEIVGIVCKVPGLTCATNFWQCESTKECIPIAYMCDAIPDCDDGSDEDPARCKSPIEVRLVGADRSGSSMNGAGRVEVRRFGIWGTICDDDFGTAEATVICNKLGYSGKAVARKEGAFGEGNGVIWLDQLHCSGNETSLDECFHQQWGQTDCQHQEDVAVICSQGDIPVTTQSTSIERKVVGEIDDLYNTVTADNILPKECGFIDANLHLLDKDFTPKVVKGQEVYRGTHPWQASIRVRTNTKSIHWCGAIVISPLHILTTAHCLVDYSKSAYFVRAGDFDTELKEGSEQEADFESIYIHEDYNKGLRLNNDLALVKLKGLGFKFDPWVRPACLPEKHTVYRPGMNCTISGWGSNGLSGSGYARRLRAATVPILSMEECRAPYVYADALSDGMFCAGDLKGGVDSCQGDSGGPFICLNQDRSTLFGITSWGLGCGRPNKPGVYTKVSLYLDWIHRKLHDSLNGR